MKTAGTVATVDAAGTLHVVGESRGAPRRYQVTGPAVLAVTIDARTPRQLGLREIMAASSKPSRVVNRADLGATALGHVDVLGRAPMELGGRHGRVITERDPDRAAALLVTELMKTGVL